MELVSKEALIEARTIMWDQTMGFQGCVLLDDIVRMKAEDAIHIPCKIGDMVWGIRKHNRGLEAMQGQVNQMLICEGTTLCICVKHVCRGEWGKTVFATKEETLAAIERLKEA